MRAFIVEEEVRAFLGVPLPALSTMILADANMRHLAAKVPRDLVRWRVQSNVPINDSKGPLARTEGTQLFISANALSISEATIRASVACPHAGTAALDANRVELGEPVLIGVDDIGL